MNKPDLPPVSVKQGFIRAIRAMVMLYIIYGYFSGPVTELSSVSDTACSIELTFLLFGSTWKMFTKLFYREEG